MYLKDRAFEVASLSEPLGVLFGKAAYELGAWSIWMCDYLVQLPPQLFTCHYRLIDAFCWVVRTDDMEQAAAHADAAILYHKNEFKVMHAKAAAACAHVHL